MQRVAGKATLVAKLDDSLDQIPNKSSIQTIAIEHPERVRSLDVDHVDHG